MKELEEARQRITNKGKSLELFKGPLLEKESNFLNELPVRFKSLLKETQLEIEEKEGAPVNEGVRFYYKYKETDNLDFTHSYWKENGKKTEQWEQETRTRTGTSVDSGFPGYVIDHFQWDSEIRPPELLIQKTKLEGQEWINKNISLKRVALYLYNDMCRLSFLTEIFDLDGKQAISVSLRNASRDTVTSTVFKDEDKMDLFIEEVVRLIENKAYIKKQNNEKTINNKEQTQLIANALPNLQEVSFENVDQRPLFDSLSQLAQDQFRSMQDDERDRVLAEIEYQETTNPDYRRPSWISNEEKSTRDLRGQSLAEREQFLNDDSFNAAVQTHFPRPPENG